MPAKKRFSLADELRSKPSATSEVLSFSKEKEFSLLTSVFDEQPVDLTTFIQGPEFMNSPRLSDIQYNAIRHIEQIYLPETYPLMENEFGEYWKPVRMVNEITLLWGKGSGKDSVCRLACARIAYLLLCLKSPQAYYGLMPQDEIHALNVAQTAPQAQRAFFRPMATALKNSPWFKDKIRSNITDKSNSVILDKGIELISGHSEAENFEGLNPIVVICDELSGFPSAEQKTNAGNAESTRSAEAIYEIVKTSAASRFQETYKAVAISYPRYQGDPTMKLLERGLKDYAEVGEENSMYYADGPRTTWDVNPRYDRFDRIKVAGTDLAIPNVNTFVEHYKLDAPGARAKYECKPSRSPNKYFKMDSAVAAAFPKQDENWVEPLQIHYTWGIQNSGMPGEESAQLSTVPGWNAEYTFSSDLIPIDGAIYALHADLAIKGDRAGISMCHVKNWEKREHLVADATNIGEIPDIQNDDRPIIKVDFATCYESDLTARNPETEEIQPREIGIRWFRNLVGELKRRGFVIGLVTFDSFASEDSIQILESWGIPSKRQSVDRTKAPYANLREIIYDGRLEGYYHKLLLDEIEGLTELPHKIDHPSTPDASKDVADAVCGAVLGALELGGSEGNEPEPVDISTNSYDFFEYETPRDNFWQGVSLEWSSEDREVLTWDI